MLLFLIHACLVSHQNGDSRGTIALSDQPLVRSRTSLDGPTRHDSLVPLPGPRPHTSHQASPSRCSRRGNTGHHHLTGVHFQLGPSSSSIKTWAAAGDAAADPSPTGTVTRSDSNGQADGTDTEACSPGDDSLVKTWRSRSQQQRARGGSNQTSRGGRASNASGKQHGYITSDAIRQASKSPSRRTNKVGESMSSLSWVDAYGPTHQEADDREGAHATPPAKHRHAIRSLGLRPTSSISLPELTKTSRAAVIGAEVHCSFNPMTSQKDLLVDSLNSPISAGRGGDSTSFQLPNSISSRPGSITLQSPSFLKLTAACNNITGVAKVRNGSPSQQKNKPEGADQVPISTNSTHSSASHQSLHPHEDNGSHRSSPLPSREFHQTDRDHTVTLVINDAAKSGCISSGSIYSIRLPSFSSREGFHRFDNDEDMTTSPRRASQRSMSRLAVLAGLTCPSKLTS